MHNIIGNSGIPIMSVCLGKEVKNSVPAESKIFKADGFLFYSVTKSIKEKVIFLPKSYIINLHITFLAVVKLGLG